MALTTEGFKELERAFNRSPETVKKHAKDFFVRSMAAYKSGIRNSPWRIGGNGGGSPVDTGALRDSHKVTFKPWSASIAPTGRPARDYAVFVHEGTQRMEARPWLEAVKKDKKGQIDEYADKMLKDIIIELAK